MERKFNEQETIRRSKLQKMVETGDNPYLVERVNRTCTLQQFHDLYQDADRETLHNDPNPKVYTLAGRVMSLRQTFGVLKDFSGTLQIYINKKTVPESVFHYFKNLDLGDIVQVQGIPMKTNTGEVTLNVRTIQTISKALGVLPEKFHGLQDEEIRARKRYIDLIMNPESMAVFVNRSLIIRAIRNYMDQQGFLEVETPVLHTTLGGATARPFITHHNTLDRDFYLRIATEIPLKKLIVGGFEKVYEIGRIFRNEGMDPTHNPEFTSIEAYMAYAGMEEMMDLCEQIFHTVAQLFPNQTTFQYRGYPINVTGKFKRVKMTEAIQEVTGIDFEKLSEAEALQLATEHAIELKPFEQSWGHVVNAFFETYCEETMIQPTFVWGHPIDVSPLAKRDAQDPRITKRFELFIGQKEFANAFSELNDPIDQYERFENQLKEGHLGNEEAAQMDVDFIEALEQGLPPTGGIGIGIDRLVMLFTERDTIRDVLLFPQMKDRN